MIEITRFYSRKLNNNYKTCLQIKHKTFLYQFYFWNSSEVRIRSFVWLVGVSKITIIPCEETISWKHQTISLWFCHNTWNSLTVRSLLRKLGAVIFKMKGIMKVFLAQQRATLKWITTIFHHFGFIKEMEFNHSTLMYNYFETARMNLKPAFLITFYLPF